MDRKEPGCCNGCRMDWALYSEADNLHGLDYYRKDCVGHMGRLHREAETSGVGVHTRAAHDPIHPFKISSDFGY